jgi:hypothetical protein
MDLLNRLKLYTIPLVSFDRNKHIESYFSGCLLKFRGFLFILSVAHGLKTKHSRVAIIMHNLPELKNIPNWQVFNPTRLRQFRTKFNTNIVKALVKILNILHLKIDYTSFLFKYIGGIDFMSSIVYLNHLPIHSLPLNSNLLGQWKYFFSQEQIIEPSFDAEYNFYGMTNFRIESTKYLCDEIFATRIKFLRTEKGHYHVFKLNHKYNNLKVCSGTPIVDNNGNLVSIVIKNHQIYNDIIYGINLKFVTIILHQEVNSVTGEEIYE